MSALGDAARAEAERRWGSRPLKPNSEMTAPDWLDEGMSSGFVLGAQWQAEQEPTDEQVEAAARTLWKHRALGTIHPDYPWGGLAPQLRQSLRELARSVLIAAYATGGTA